MAIALGYSAPIAGSQEMFSGKSRELGLSAANHKFDIVVGIHVRDFYFGMGVSIDSEDFIYKTLADASDG